jgi:hypothetical protein
VFGMKNRPDKIGTIEMSIFKYSCIVAFLVLITLVSGCADNVETTRQNSGQYLLELQKEVPFTIVIPKYFPREIPSDPVVISGPSSAPELEHSVSFGLIFRAKGSEKSIHISEQNLEKVAMPSEVDSIYLDILGVKVLEENMVTSVLISKNKRVDVSGFYYGWYHNAVFFDVEILGFDKQVSRKVIESMIK